MKLLKILDRCKWFGFRKLFYLVRNLTGGILDLVGDIKSMLCGYGQSIIKRGISRKIIRCYNGDEGQNVEFGNFFLGYGFINYAFVKNLKPKNILCVGSRKGYIPVILSLACKDNNYGLVDFVDAGFDQDNAEKHWSGIGFWNKINPRKHFSSLGSGSFINTYVMTTEKYAGKFPNKKFQYVYIDGDHSYEGVKMDYSMFWPRLEKGGLMLFHDAVAKGYLDKGLFGVNKFWREISSRNKIIFPFPEDSGLGVIQKLEN